MSDLKSEFKAAQAAFSIEDAASIAGWQSVLDRVYAAGLKLAGGPGVKDLYLEGDAVKAKPAPAPAPAPVEDAPAPVEIRDDKPTFKKAGK